MTITHSTIKAVGQKLFAIGDWNADHTGTTIGSVLFVGAGNVIEEDNSNLFWNNVNKRLGIGAEPKYKLHVFVSDSGATAIDGFDSIVLERGTNAGFTFLTPDANSGSMVFGSPSDAFGAQIRWKFADKLMTIGTANADGELSIQSANKVEGIRIDENQKVGIRTSTPTTQFSVLEKSGMSPIGGFMVKLTNKTGVNSVAGDIVRASAAQADAVSWGIIDELHSIGVFLESGIADGSEAWVVVGGIADVHMDAGGCLFGDRIIAGGTARRGEASNLPAVGVHFQEIGHAIETAAGNALARINLHFL